MFYDLASRSRGTYLSHAKTFSRHPRFRLLAGVDPDARARARFQQRYRREAFANAVEALKKHPAEVVILASPTKTHVTELRKILRASQPRAILCEKPLAEKPAEALEMVRLCQRNGVPLFVNYMRRSDPAVLKVKQMICEGKISTPLCGVVWYTKGFLHNASHFFQLLEFWLGPALRGRLLQRRHLRGKHDADAEIWVEFQKGSVTFQPLWADAYAHAEIQLFSPCGRLRYEQAGSCVLWEQVRKDPLYAQEFSLQERGGVIRNGMRTCFWQVADQLANALAGRRAELCTGHQAWEIIHKMDRFLRGRD